MTVRFDVSATERATALKIAKRAADLAEKHGTRLNVLDTHMDLCATHASGCRLDFDRLLDADDFNLLHDVVGIARHLDRESGTLTNGFSPRFSA